MGNTPFTYATFCQLYNNIVIGKNIKKIKKFITNNTFDVNLQASNNGRTLLMCSTLNNQPTLSKLLIEKGMCILL